MDHLLETWNTNSLTKTERLLPWHAGSGTVRTHILAPLTGSELCGGDQPANSSARPIGLDVSHRKLLHEINKAQNASLVSAAVKATAQQSRKIHLDKIVGGSGAGVGKQSSLLIDIQNFIDQQMRDLSETFSKQHTKKVSKKKKKDPTLNKTLLDQPQAFGGVAAVMTEEERYARERLHIFRRVLDVIGDAYPTLRHLLRTADEEYMELIAFLSHHVSIHQEVIQGLRQALSKQRTESDVMEALLRKDITRLESEGRVLVAKAADLKEKLDEERTKYLTVVDMHTKLRRLQNLLNDAQGDISKKQFEIDRLKVENDHLHLECFTDTLTNLADQSQTWKSQAERLAEEIKQGSTVTETVVLDFKRVLMRFAKKNELFVSKIKLHPVTQGLFVSTIGSLDDADIADNNESTTPNLQLSSFLPVKKVHVDSPDPHSPMGSPRLPIDQRRKSSPVNSPRRSSPYPSDPSP